MSDTVGRGKFLVNLYSQVSERIVGSEVGVGFYKIPLLILFLPMGKLTKSQKFFSDKGSGVWMGGVSPSLLLPEEEEGFRFLLLRSS